jgi:hypothetical protein
MKIAQMRQGATFLRPFGDDVDATGGPAMVEGDGGGLVLAMNRHPRRVDAVNVLQSKDRYYTREGYRYVYFCNEPLQSEQIYAGVRAWTKPFITPGLYPHKITKISPFGDDHHGIRRFEADNPTPAGLVSDVFLAKIKSDEAYQLDAIELFSRTLSVNAFAELKNPYTAEFILHYLNDQSTIYLNTINEMNSGQIRHILGEPDITDEEIDELRRWFASDFATTQTTVSEGIFDGSSALTALKKDNFTGTNLIRQNNEYGVKVCNNYVATTETGREEYDLNNPYGTDYMKFSSRRYGRNFRANGQNVGARLAYRLITFAQKLTAKWGGGVAVSDGAQQVARRQIGNDFQKTNATYIPNQFGGTFDVDTVRNNLSTDVGMVENVTDVEARGDVRVMTYDLNGNGAAEDVYGDAKFDWAGIMKPNPVLRSGFNALSMITTKEKIPIKVIKCKRRLRKYQKSFLLMTTDMCK